MNYIITTKRLGLRLWEDKDCSPFTVMNKDADVMKYYPSTLTEEETLAMINRINNHFIKHGFGLFAVDELTTKSFIGYTGFMVPSFESYFTPCVEIGWRLKKQAWHKGYATEAGKACLQYGFEKLLFEKVYSFTSIINISSEKVMQRIGMIKYGEFDHPNISKDNVLCNHVVYKIDHP